MINSACVNKHPDLNGTQIITMQTDWRQGADDGRRPKYLQVDYVPFMKDVGTQR